MVPQEGFPPHWLLTAVFVAGKLARNCLASVCLAAALVWRI